MRPWGPVIVALFATIGMLMSANGAPSNPVHFVAGLVLAVLAPGYGLLLALQPTGVARLERLVLSVPISLGLVIALTVLFDHTPPGLEPLPIVLAEWLLSIGLLAIGAYRCRWFRDARWSLPRPAVSGRTLVEAALGVLVLSGAGVWSANSIAHAARDQPKAFTSLSVEHQSDAGMTPRIVVDNEEGQSMTYDLEVDIGGQRRLSTPDVALASGAQYSIAEPDNPQQQSIDVLLYRGGDPSSVYRRLHIASAAEAASQ